MDLHNIITKQGKLTTSVTKYSQFLVIILLACIY